MLYPHAAIAKRTEGTAHILDLDHLTRLIPSSSVLILIMNNSTAHTGNRRYLARKRPASIAELAEMWDDTKDFKHYLGMAEKIWTEGRDWARKGNFEGAFVALARAATLVLEKLPMHRDYDGILNAKQRQNLSLVRISIIISLFTDPFSSKIPPVCSSYLITYHFRHY